MNKIKRMLLYAGLEREEFDALIPDAMRENGQNLISYSLIATALFFCLALANLLSGQFRNANTVLYAAVAIFNLILYLFTRFTLPNRPQLTLMADLAFMVALYAFSLALGLLHPDRPSVTFIAVMLVAPFLFSERPIDMMALTVVAATADCLLSSAFKAPEIVEGEIWNAISFGAVAMLAELIQMRVRFRLLLQSRKITYLSETDLLTGAKNRNCYQEWLTRYPGICQQRLVCVYADVNGLHNLNDTKGHSAGDVMLQTVARELLSHFGEAHTYRIGGDEFVCFRVDGDEAEVQRDVAEICALLTRQGYSLSTGIASAAKAGLNMTMLTGMAESEMYLDKRRYYLQEGHNRRKH